MADSAFIFEATPDNFTQLVLDNSAKGPVLVNYWAPWAGPCLKLWPVLDQLARHYAGRFLLVNINTDKHKTLARDYGINSLPTLKMYRHGKVVDEVHGAESEQSLRAFIDKHIARPSDRLLALALGRYQQGDTAAALALLAEAALDDPDNARLPLTQAKLLLREQRHADVQALIDALPKASQDQAEFANLYAHAGFLAAAGDAPAAEQLQARIAQDGGDLIARYQLSALALLNDAYEPALEQLLEIVRRDRGFMNDIGRRGMTAIFALLGREHELSQRYRVLLNNVLN
jgi:putative thioredoxin